MDSSCVFVLIWCDGVDIVQLSKMSAHPLICRPVLSLLVDIYTINSTVLSIIYLHNKCPTIHLVQ